MTTTKRQSRASRASDQAEQDQPEVEETEETEAQPEPEAKPELPVAAGDLGKGRISYYWPSLRLEDGTTVECVHSKWGHSQETTAAKCLRALAAEHGVKVEVPES